MNARSRPAVRSAGGAGDGAPDPRLRRPDRLYPGYLFDLDGTVYLGSDPLPGAAASIAALRSAGSRVAFLSNNPLERSAAYAARLRAMDVPVDDDDVVSSIDALIGYLRDRPAVRILAIAEALVQDELRGAGYELTDEPRRADAVVVSWDRTFTYDKLQRAFDAIRNGARLIATNADPYCPTPEGGMPDCGALLAAIEVSTGVTAEAVVGKPSAHIARVALERLGLPPHDVVMVGDRLLTDVALARTAGMVGALVLTGATSLADAAAASPAPDLILERLDQLIPARLSAGDRPPDQKGSPA